MDNTVLKKHLIGLLNERRSYLTELISQKQISLRNAPEGRLRVSCKNGVRYYHRKTKGEKEGSYIPKAKRGLARALAQKDYDSRLIAAAEQELKLEDKLIQCFDGVTAEDVFAELTLPRRELLNPLSKDDESYVREWLDYHFEGLGFEDFASEYVTRQGEAVRSKSEIMIADALAMAKVPFRYECPLHLHGFGTVYPDFTVLNVSERKVYYWEHFGMMDHPDYVAKTVRKISRYQMDGIFPGKSLIMTFETGSQPLDSRTIERVISEYLL